MSYELDRLYRAGRRAPNIDLTSERAEAGRILLTASSHDGMSSDDRAYLIQQVAGATGLAGPDAERRVNSVIVNAKTAIARSTAYRHSCVFGGDCSFTGRSRSLGGGLCRRRHRDGAPLPDWMARSNLIDRRRAVMR